MGPISQSVESTRRVHHEHDRANNRQARMLESRAHGENGSSVLFNLAQGPTEAERK